MKKQRIFFVICLILCFFYVPNAAAAQRGVQSPLIPVRPITISSGVSNAKKTAVCPTASVLTSAQIRDFEKNTDCTSTVAGESEVSLVSFPAVLVQTPVQNSAQKTNSGENLLKKNICMTDEAFVEREKQIAFSQSWLALLHYRPAFLNTYKSSIDSESFFLSPDGAVNPLSEYRASIALFQGEDIQKKCLFPARYLYLKERGVIHGAFPDCPEYQQFQKDLNPAGVTLIYTDAYMNNPASLFGHTLMRIDVPPDKTQLIAHGMNYGAFVGPDENGLLFAVYGLTGGYYGGFTVKPYYNVINMYNNIENRDIWEFQLNLTDKERDFYVAHLWELGHTQTRYYFFTKNCSYLLTEVLDAVRPEMKLADRFPLQAIPLDTLKAVADQRDFIKTVRYRPSRQRRLAWRYAQMTAAEKKALIAYLRDVKNTDLSDLPEAGKIAVLDAAYEYIQYQWVRQDISLSDYRQKSFAVLRQRRDIQTLSDEVKVPGVSPLSAHDSARVAVATGWSRGRPFQEISLRPAYHSLTDAPAGLLSGAEINFLDVSLRYYDRTKHLYLQSIDILKISSLAPYNALFHPLSYQVQTGIRRTFNPKTKKEGELFTLKGGSGLTFEPVPDLYLFGLVNTAFSYGGGFIPHHQGMALSVLGGMGYYFKKAQFLIQGEQFVSDNWFMQRTSAKAEFVVNLSQNSAFCVSSEIAGQKYHSSNEVKMTFKRFF